MSRRVVIDIGANTVKLTVFDILKLEMKCGRVVLMEILPSNIG